MNESAGSLQIEDRFEGFIAGTTNSGEMQIDRIKEDPNQPRKSFDQQALQDLADNVTLTASSNQFNFARAIPISVGL